MRTIGVELTLGISSVLGRFDGSALLKHEADELGQSNDVLEPIKEVISERRE